MRSFFFLLNSHIKTESLPLSLAFSLSLSLDKKNALAGKKNSFKTYFTFPYGNNPYPQFRE